MKIGCVIKCPEVHFCLLSSWLASTEDAVRLYGQVATNRPKSFLCPFLTIPSTPALWTRQEKCVAPTINPMSICIRTPTSITRVYYQRTVFNPEDEDKMLLRNASKIDHLHTVLKSKQRISIDTSSPRQPQIIEVLCFK
jgi:hypothetical protein